MKTVYSDAHLGHAGYVELTSGHLAPGFEKPVRAEYIRARVEAVGLGPIVPPEAHGLDAAAKVHDPAYLNFLSKAWALWTEAGNHVPALPMSWPVPGLRKAVPPTRIDGLLGYYSLDAGAPIVAGTWAAVTASLDCALTAADLVAGGERAAYGLCRPPGHHAGSSFMGGYCYINNAAVVAAAFRDRGAGRVAILDVDYHHGNGTQEIFYRDGTVLVANLHADPREEYPYFLGHADERGEGAGEGANLNYPMPLGTAFDRWSAALDDACERIAAFGAEVVIVSLGVDTFEKDPISGFRLKTEDFPRIGARIARLGRPTVFLQEGGYAVAEIGVNAVGVLAGFEEG